jgi:hypothetical protein
MKFEVTVMRQLAMQRAFFEPAHEFAMKADPGPGDLDHLLMLAIERALAPPIVHRRSTLQPMRIVVVDREMFLSPDEKDQIGGDLPRLLPRANHRSHRTGRPFHQRAVRGEILSDETGRLYEKLGRQIRPLHQLASGPFGEVIDLVPAQQAILRGQVPAPQPQVVEPSEITNPSVEKKETVNANQQTANSKFVPVQESTKPASTVSYRKQFADPGQWRVLWWGEFKEILSPQLAHPERLRDTYRLPCYVQVLETEREVSISELAGIYKSDVRQARLYFLTDEIAAKLDLVLPLRAAPPRNSPRPSDTLLPHERVFRLIVANDPTIDIANSKSNLQTSSSNTEVKGTETGSNHRSLKCAIPVRFLKEWEFKLSRDEALYDMNARTTLVSLILNIGRRLRVAKRRNEFCKWQVLLTGKDTDDQLWAVRPPEGRFTDSLVREWARKTLELGGYDSNKMITEWEIFWRRRGL